VNGFLRNSLSVVDTEESRPTLYHTQPMYLAGQPVLNKTSLDVTEKFSGDIISRASRALPKDFDRAIEAAHQARGAIATLSANTKRNMLEYVAQKIVEKRDHFEKVLIAEAGKTRAQARNEISRAIDTFKLASHETSQQVGTIAHHDDWGYVQWKRIPIGVCGFITPFNFPLNLVAHKIAPAIAAGCPFILKPASLTPLSALLLGNILCDLDLPSGSFSILPANRKDASALIDDDRVRLLSFTGSSEVGWRIKRDAPKKKVILELGGNAATIVEADTNLDFAAKRIVSGGFSLAGQSCISVQRVLVDESIYEPLKSRLRDHTARLRVGDPTLQNIDIGPMISRQEKLRIESWIDQSVAKGASIYYRADIDPNLSTICAPTILEKVSQESAIYCEEAFGPVIVLEPYHCFEAAIERVNTSRFGLHVGVFTTNLNKMLYAWDNIEVGGVVIGDIPTIRQDSVPYGGVKDSGCGREGPKYAIEDMTEIRTLLVRHSTRESLAKRDTCQARDIHKHHKTLSPPDEILISHRKKNTRTL